MEEIWKDIYFIENGVEYDYRGLYQVSNLGNVKSLNYNHTDKEKMLKFETTWQGYYRVMLKGKHRFMVHRLVAHMFIEGYFDGAFVDHINTNRTDNRPENLRWVTIKENNNNELTRKHVSDGQIGKEVSDETRKRISKNRKGKCTGKDHHSSKSIAQYDLNGNLIKVWDYMAQISEVLNFHHSAICRCCKGKQKTAYGFIWKYTE